VHELISWYQDWKQVEKSSQIKLVLAGHQESSVIIPDVSEISYLGFVSDAERDFLIQNCFALVNPSVYESLSMIVIEAIMAGKPVLARRQCKVFEFYARFAPSVRLFGDGCELGEELLRQLDIGSEESQRDIAISKSWAVARFSWDSILETFKLQVEG
jgi:glycosyltransferase involved in cell wall biosynthesis